MILEADNPNQETMMSNDRKRKPQHPQPARTTPPHPFTMGQTREDLVQTWTGILRDAEMELEGALSGLEAAGAVGLAAAVRSGDRTRILKELKASGHEDQRENILGFAARYQEFLRKKAKAGGM